MKKSIFIDQPCNMNWDTMSPNKNGRYCNTCKLTVVDFTHMTEDEIHQYLVGRLYVCGRFTNNQVENENEKISSIKEKAILYSLSVIKFGMLLLFALPILISSCYNSISKENGKTIKKEKPSRRLMGAVSYRPDKGSHLKTLNKK